MDLFPGDYSLLCFGAVVVEPGLERSFYGRLKPVSERWIPQALAVSGFSREETLQFDKTVMEQFEEGLKAIGGGRPRCLSPTTTGLPPSPKPQGSKSPTTIGSAFKEWLSFYSKSSACGIFALS